MTAHDRSQDAPARPAGAPPDDEETPLPREAPFPPGYLDPLDGSGTLSDLSAVGSAADERGRPAAEEAALQRATDGAGAA